MGARMAAAAVAIVGVVVFVVGTGRSSLPARPAITFKVRTRRRRTCVSRITFRGALRTRRTGARQIDTARGFSPSSPIRERSLAFAGDGIGELCRVYWRKHADRERLKPLGRGDRFCFDDL